MSVEKGRWKKQQVAYSTISIKSQNIFRFLFIFFVFSRNHLKLGKLFSTSYVLKILIKWLQYTFEVLTISGDEKHEISIHLHTILLSYTFTKFICVSLFLHLLLLLVLISLRVSSRFSNLFLLSSEIKSKNLPHAFFLSSFAYSISSYLAFFSFLLFRCCSIFGSQRAERKNREEKKMYIERITSEARKSASLQAIKTNALKHWWKTEKSN